MLNSSLSYKPNFSVLWRYTPNKDYCKFTKILQQNYSFTVISFRGLQSFLLPTFRTFIYNNKDFLS